MDPTQNVSQPTPDSLHAMPEVTGIQSHLNAMNESPANETSGAIASEVFGASVKAAQTAAAAAHAAAAPVTPPPITGDDDEANATTAPADMSGNPPAAEDKDLIEQEWVTKAKAIVESTKADPFLQNKEINKFKADYIKKRYQRDIKVSEA